MAFKVSESASTSIKYSYSLLKHILHIMTIHRKKFSNEHFFSAREYVVRVQNIYFKNEIQQKSIYFYRRLHCDVTRGTVLRPPLFSIYINSLFEYRQQVKFSVSQVKRLYFILLHRGTKFKKYKLISAALFTGLTIKY